MHGLPERVVVWVEDIDKLYTYVLITEGEDAGMAYEVTMKPMGSRPLFSDDENSELEVVANLVELDYQVRARLSLTQIGAKLVVQNAIWRAFGTVAKSVASGMRQLGLDVPSVRGGVIRTTNSWREYRRGHPKYSG